MNTLAAQERVGVLWTGAAATHASEGAARAGVHRVIYPRTPQERLTFWYEMPTVAPMSKIVRSDDSFKSRDWPPR